MLVAAAVVGAVVLVLAVASRGPSYAYAFADFRTIEVLGLRIGGAGAYFAFWVAGGMSAAVAFLIIARGQRVLSLTSVVAGPVFTVGFVYGAMLQGRLEDGVTLQALLIDPAHLIGSGMRLPLGIVLGGALAFVWCRVTGAPWLLVGDRLAVAAATWEAVGRLGCLMTGCCLGTVCPAWLATVCPRYPQGTQAFLDQVQRRLVDPASPLSEPVHVLPAYFSLASLVTLVVLGYLFRRRVPPGTMLGVFAVAYPVVKLAIESLRAAPRPGPWMTLIPCLVFAVGVATLWHVRPRRRVRAPGILPARLLF